MTQEWFFWGIALAGLVLALGLVLAPLWRGTGRGGRRASYDLQVHSDQLREVDADLERGVLTPAEAEASRIEISRRLIAAADAEALEADAASAPRRLTRRAVPAFVLSLGLASLGLYGWLGAPGLPDQPLARRVADAAAARANRPSQVEAEAMIAARAAPVERNPESAELVRKLQDILKDRPDDVEGHRLLARSLASLARWPEARAAQERVVALLGEKATADDLVNLAEAQILATDGYVSPEAEAVLGRALRLAPDNPVARYYSALALLGEGRPDLALTIWQRLASEGPAEAPWMAATRAGLAEAARQLGMSPPPPTTTEPASPGPASPEPTSPPPGSSGPSASGPTDDDMRAAGELSDDARQSMIEGMVAQLSNRLATEGGPPADWARLIRSLAVLGRQEQATAVLDEARRTFATDAAGLGAVNAAAAEAGLPAPAQ